MKAFCKKQKLFMRKNFSRFENLVTINQSLLHSLFQTKYFLNVYGRAGGGGDLPPFHRFSVLIPTNQHYPLFLNKLSCFIVFFAFCVVKKLEISSGSNGEQILGHR
jgi:hypothetical protein